MEQFFPTALGRVFRSDGLTSQPRGCQMDHERLRACRPYAVIASFSALTPMMFITRVKL
jgi:hypothetical protein